MIFHPFAGLCVCYCRYSCCVHVFEVVMLCVEVCVWGDIAQCMLFIHRCAYVLSYGVCVHEREIVMDVCHSKRVDVALSVLWLASQYFGVHQSLGMWGQSWVTHCHSFPILDYIVCLSPIVCFIFLVFFACLRCCSAGASTRLFVACLVSDRH